MIPMVGLEKVKNKLSAEARADADRILAEADAKCRAIFDEANAEAEQYQNSVADETEKECESIVSRARSAAAQQRRNILLSEKCRAVDSVFAAAEKKICSMPKEKYLSFLTALICQAAGEQKGKCIVTLNKKDRAEIGSELIESLSAACDKMSFKLSENEARIKGGVLLDFGMTDIDCSVSALISQARPVLESDVSRVLFGK